MTNSIAFPNMFDVTRNSVAVIEDNQSIVNRVRLLMLTEPTELYNSPDFGAGMKRYLWQYNNDNQIAIIKDRLIQQLDLHEPCVKATETKLDKGLQYSESNRLNDTTDYSNANVLNLTVTLQTIYGDIIDISMDNNYNTTKTE